MKRLLPFLLTFVFVAACDEARQAATAVETPAADSAAAPAETTAAAEPAAAAVAADTDERIELAQADLDAVEAAGFVEGEHYARLSPAQPTSSSPDEVEVVEFFMHSCIHCYNLEPYVQAWVEDKPDYINFVRVPTTWDAYRTLHAQAFYTAESLGIAEEIHLPMFREIHDAGNTLETLDKLASFFARFDVNRDEFDSHFNSFAVMTKVNRAAELGQRYRVQSTPMIVVNGKYRTGNEAGSPDELFELIELLAASERG